MRDPYNRTIRRGKLLKGTAIGVSPSLWVLGELAMSNLKIAFGEALTHGTWDSHNVKVLGRGLVPTKINSVKGLAL